MFAFRWCVLRGGVLLWKVPVKKEKEEPTLLDILKHPRKTAFHQLSWNADGRSDVISLPVDVYSPNRSDCALCSFSALQPACCLRAQLDLGVHL